MGVMQALISFVEEDNDQLRCVERLFDDERSSPSVLSCLHDLLVGFRPCVSLPSQLFFCVDSWFAAGEHKFVFLKRDPLLLVTVAKTNEPYPHVRNFKFHESTQ